VALAVLWVVLYLVWVAVRPTPPVAPTSRPAGRSATTTTTTAPPLFKFKP